MPLIERPMSEAEKRRAIVAEKNDRPLPAWIWTAVDRGASPDYKQLWRHRTGARRGAEPSKADMAEAGIYVPDDDPMGIL